MHYVDGVEVDERAVKSFVSELNGKEFGNYFKVKLTKRKAQKGRGGRAILVDPVAGTRDFLPQDFIYQKWLFDTFRRVSDRFAYQEYDCPILEPAELYKRKAGEDITKQMYNFVDKSGLEVALRPEMTPSLTRLILKQGKILILPIKWYSIPQCWRFEETTRGRKREHYQWNVDIWGIPDQTAEAELLATLVSFFREVKLSSQQVQIRVNSRELIQLVLNYLGVPDKAFAQVCVLIDKLDKLEKDVVEKSLTDLGLNMSTITSVMEYVESKSLDDISALLKKYAQQKAGDTFDEAKYKNPKALDELITFFGLLEGYGISDWVIFDPSVIRGLSYYTGIVFEAFAVVGELKRAVCGGGRYNKICSIYGEKKDIPACGFGFGDVVIMEILRDLNLLPKLEHNVDDLVIPFGKDFRPAANQVAMMLRAAGKDTDIFLKTPKLKNAFSYADRIGATRAILVAPDEWAKGCVKVKYLREEDESKKEYVVSLKDLPTFEADL